MKIILFFKIYNLKNIIKLKVEINFNIWIFKIEINYYFLNEKTYFFYTKINLKLKLYKKI